MTSRSPERDVARPIRVAIADDSYLVREALTRILARSSAVEFVRGCSDRDSLLAAVEADSPDAVVVDIRMPPTGTDEGIQVARTLRETHPAVGVVVLSQYSEPSYAIALLESGSAGRAYLLKDRVHRSGELVSAIRSVANGGSVIDPAVVELLVQERAQARTTPMTELTEREHQVLAEVAQGKSNSAIAESLVLSKRAVEKHINSIFLKLDLTHEHDVSQRVKATLMFLAGEHGLGGRPEAHPGRSGIRPGVRPDA